MVTSLDSYPHFHLLCIPVIGVRLGVEKIKIQDGVGPGATQKGVCGSLEPLRQGAWPIQFLDVVYAIPTTLTVTTAPYTTISLAVGDPQGSDNSGR